MQNTTTARNDGNRLASVRPVGGVWIVTFGAKTSDGQTVRRQTGSALRRFQWLTSVAFGATAGPQKEGALVCSKGANLGPARGSSAGPSPSECAQHGRTLKGESP